MKPLTPMGILAIQYCNIPYVWGGYNPLIGLDCSGLAQLILDDVGIDPKGDQTAQNLYYELVKRNWRSQLGPDAILFFGKSRYKITHVGIALTYELMIHAGGGGSKVLTLSDAQKFNARVKIQRIDHRKDLQAVIMPVYSIGQSSQINVVD